MTATHSKLEKLSFSGTDEKFAAFSEQFEEKMHMINLGKCLDSKATEGLPGDEAGPHQLCQHEGRV